MLSGVVGEEEKEKRVGGVKIERDTLLLMCFTYDKLNNNSYNFRTLAYKKPSILPIILTVRTNSFKWKYLKKPLVGMALLAETYNIRPEFS